MTLKLFTTALVLAAVLPARAIANDKRPHIAIVIGPKRTDMTVDAVSRQLIVTSDAGTTYVPLKSADLQALSKTISRLAPMKPHSNILCRRKVLTLNVAALSKDFCLASKAPAGVLSAKLAHMLNLAMRIRSKDRPSK